MGERPARSLKARELLSALVRAGFRVVRQKGSHRRLAHPDGRVLTFAFHDRATIGPALVAKVCRDAGLDPWSV